MRMFRLGGDNELAALKADMRKRTARSLMRGDDNLHRVEHASGAQVDTSTSGGVESRHAACQHRDAFQGEVAIARAGESDAEKSRTAKRQTPKCPEAGVAPGPLTHQRSGPPVAPSSPSAPARSAVSAAPYLLVLPWPPTGNHAYPTGSDGRRHASTEVSRYRRHVAALCYGAGKVAGRYVLHVHLSPPDARARDMDNAVKSIADALVRAGWLPSDAMTYMRELHVTTDDARNASAIVRAVPITTGGGK